MSPTEVIYVVVLLSSVGFGQVIKYAKSAAQKQFVCTSVGVVMVVGLCGWQTYHSVLSVAVTVAIIRGIGPDRKCHLWCFVFCFSYLLIFRLGYFIGLAPPTGFSNVVQLLLTLRLVGISFEIHDSHAARIRARDESLNHSQQNGKPRYVAIIKEPSIADICQYGFCYIGLFSGPYYTYKTYYDMLHCDHSYSVPTTGPIIEKLKRLVPLAAIYVAMSPSRYSTADFFLTEEFYSHGYFERLLFTGILVTAYRLRMYSAWLLAECVCISATLGAYPVSTKPKVGLGPSIDPAENESSNHKQQVEYNYDTIQNIDWYHCESTTDFRSAMRYWNMTVQWWLKSFVYRRFPYRSWSTFVTFLVSGYWHGIYPGYFLCFLTTPIILIAEDRMRVFRRGDGFWYDKVGWVMKVYTFQYIHMGFQLLGFWATLRHWASTFFLGHLLTGLFMVIASTAGPRKAAKKVE